MSKAYNIKIQKAGPVFLAMLRLLSAFDLESWKDGGGASAAQRRYTQRIAA